MNNHRENQILEFEEVEPLEFDQIRSQGSTLNHTDFNPLIFTQRKTNSELILTGNLDELKIFQIENKQLKFVTAHKLEFPVIGSNFKRIISEDTIHIFFIKSSIPMTHKHSEFFKQHDINLGSSLLAFEFRFGVNQPERIKPNFLGELLFDTKFTLDFKIEHFFNEQKTLSSRKTFLVQKPPRPPQTELGQGEVYLAELRSSSHSHRIHLIKIF